MAGHLSGTVTKNAAALFVGRALVMVASFVFIVYAARLLGVSGFGRYALARMYFDLLLTLAVTGLGTLLTREIAKTPSLGPLYFGTAAPMAIGLSVMMGSAIVLLSPLVGYGAEVRSLLWLASLALVPAVFAMLSESVFVAIGKAHYVMVGTSAEALLYAGTGLVLLWHGSGGGSSLFVALLVTRSLLAVAYAMLFWRRFGEVPRPGSYAFAQQLCCDWRTFAFENWLANLRSAIATIVLSLFHREAVIGLYAAASRVTHFGSPLVASFTSAMFPYLTRLHGESSPQFRRVGEDSLKYMLALALPAVVTGAVFADWIILTLYGEAYVGAVPVLRIVIWAFVFSFVNPFVSHVLFARAEQATSLRVGAVTSLVSLVLSFVLIPQWGAVGAAWVVLATSALACSLFCAAAFRPDPSAVLLTFGKAGVAAATLAGVLAMWRHAHPAALTIAALGTYVGVLLLLRVSTAREFSTFLRGLP